MKITDVVKKVITLEGVLNEQASKLLSAEDKDGVITIIVQAPDGTKRSVADTNPNYINQWLMKYGLRLPVSITSKFVGVTEGLKEDANFMPAGDYQGYPIEVRKTKFNDKYFIAQTTRPIGKDILKAAGATQDEALQKLKGSIDEIVAKSQTHKKNITTVGFGAPFVQGLLRKGGQKFYAKFSDGKLLVSDVPESGYSTVSASQPSPTGNFKVSDIKDAGLRISTRYELVPTGNENGFEAKQHSTVTSSSDKYVMPFPGMTIQHPDRSGVAEEFRPTAGQAMGIRSQIAQKMNPGSSKFVWKRPNQIAGSHTENELRALKFRYSAKYNSWGGTQQMWSSLEGTLKEFSPIKPPIATPTGGNGPKDYGQPTSSRYSGGNKFVLGTSNNYVLTATVDKWGLEWDEDNNIWYLDSPGAAHIADATEGEIELPAPQEQRNQIHDLVTDYLNDHNLAELQRVAAYYGHSADGEMATTEGIRVPAQQILGTKNRAKSAYYPTNVKPKVPKLDTPLTDKELTRLSQLAGVNPNK